MDEEKRRKSIAEFFKRERDRMVGYVRRLIDDTAERDGEDIVQDVILNIFDSADFTIPIENLSAYIYQSLRNKIIDLLRKRRDAVSLDAVVSDDKNLSLHNILHDVRYETFAEFEKKEVRERIFDAIDSLNVEQKAIVIMTEFEGQTFRDISEEWGIPIGTLLARKSRAIKKVKEAVADLI